MLQSDCLREDDASEIWPIAVRSCQCQIEWMRTAAVLFAGVALASCQSGDEISYPSDYHQYDDLRSFRAPPIEQIDGRSYRLTWHPWHKTPSLILANCNETSCFIEVRFTDGYGTYTQGKLRGVRKQEISFDDFRKIERAFNEADFNSLEPHLREGNASQGLYEPQSDDVVAIICVHAPAYYLETYDGFQKRMIYRYCQDDYDEGLRIAMPLIELAERSFPLEMKAIVAEWIEDERAGRTDIDP